MLQCRDIDDLMMGWLYEELDEDASEDVEVHAEQCARCANELNSLKQTRAAFRDLAEEEPPAAASAILLHEAARRAPAPAPSAIGESPPGLLDRFLGLFRPLVLHPAATAVATLLVVGGVFGTLYVKQGKDQVARPTAAVDAPAEKPAAAAEEPEPLQSEAREEVASGERGDRFRMARGSEDSYAADLLDAERSRELEAELEEEAERSAGRESATASRLEKKEKRRPRPANRRGRNKKGDIPSANAVTGTDPLIALGGSSEGAASAPDSPRGDGAGADDDRFRPYDTKELAWAEQKRERLTKAVSDKQCRRAAAIANDILDRNPAYYTSRVKGSDEIKECRRYVQKERSRRLARRRAARETPEGGKSGKASRKQAAPVRDEAAATADSDE